MCHFHLNTREIRLSAGKPLCYYTHMQHHRRLLHFFIALITFKEEHVMILFMQMHTAP